MTEQKDREGLVSAMAPTLTHNKEPLSLEALDNAFTELSRGLRQISGTMVVVSGKIAGILRSLLAARRRQEKIVQRRYFPHLTNKQFRRILR